MKYRVIIGQFSYFPHIPFFLGLGMFLAMGCFNTPPSEPPELRRAQPEDFADTSQVAVQVAKGFYLDLWAPGSLLSNAVALTMDNQGVAYVSETSRRKSSDLDIRQHRDWMVEDLGLQTIEDTEAFHKRKLAPELSAQNTWMEDFNGDSIRDWKDLEVQSEYIRRIVDEDGDGKADVSSLYADGFNSMLTGVAAGIVHHEGEVFMTAAPDVWRLRDKNKDGVADEREVISHGYGIHIAYAGHDMSGLTIGPDGKVYWSIGDIGVNVVDQHGKRWAYPNQGAVMRANPDGSDFEVFAHGLRNPQELAFDAYGNLISVDNDGDHPGEHERFVHIVEGSDTGWRINWQFGKYDLPNEEYKIWMDEQLHVPHFPGQAAYLLPPLALASDGPAGLAYNPGTALGGDWNNYFFSSHFKGSSAQSKIVAFQLQPKGASFEVVNTQDVVQGIVPTGVTFGPDGALYFNDWLDGYQKKPIGRIWKLDVQQKNEATRKNTQEILKAGMKNRPVEELSELLGHADMRVRMAAQFELVRQNEGRVLAAMAEPNHPEFARLHAIWGLGQLACKDKSNGETLVPLLKDSNEHVRAQAAKVLGDARYSDAFSELIKLVTDSAPRARFFAAEALGKLENKEAFDPLVKLLEETGDKDPHLRHAICFALSRLDMAAELGKLATHPSKEVRIGAVVALRHIQSPEVAKFLKDTEPWVLAEAARAINDDQSIPEALPALAAALLLPNVENEAFLRRAINANLRLGDEASAERLVEFARRASAPSAMRADALWALGYGGEPLVMDRVDGRYRELDARSGEIALAALETHWEDLYAVQNPSVLAAAISATGRLGMKAAEARVFALLTQPKQNLNVRKVALNTLADLDSDQMVDAMNLALSSRDKSLRTAAQELLGRLKLPEETRVQMLAKVLTKGSVEEQQQALGSLATLSSPQAEELLGKWVERLEKNKLIPDLQLDVMMAVEKGPFKKLKNRLEDYEASKPQDDLLAAYQESMYGGNRQRGRRIFYRNNSAQCIRCHQIDGLGGEVGPELTDIASELNREELLASLILPSERLAPGYGTVILDLKNGKKVVGVLQEESTKQLIVKAASGEEQTIPIADISQRQNAPSGMPTMKEVLDRSELRDVVAFLATLKAANDL